MVNATARFTDYSAAGQAAEQFRKLYPEMRVRVVSNRIALDGSPTTFRVEFRDGCAWWKPATNEQIAVAEMVGV